MWRNFQASHAFDHVLAWFDGLDATMEAMV
jgi:hypothetical protein